MARFNATSSRLPRSETPVNKHWYRRPARKCHSKGCHEICLSSCGVLFSRGMGIMMPENTTFAINSVFRCFPSNSLTQNTPAKCMKQASGYRENLICSRASTFSRNARELCNPPTQNPPLILMMVSH